jgi:hypothetical protein
VLCERTQSCKSHTHACTCNMVCALVLCFHSFYFACCIFFFFPSLRPSVLPSLRSSSPTTRRARKGGVLAGHIRAAQG